jgi:two-component system NtrC family response regulator
LGPTRPDPVDLRIVTATHHDVAGLVDEGRFRKDLYFRLNVLPIHIPPLRERPSDIAELAAYFLKEASVPESMGLSQAAMKRLQEYAWPGNVRELRNAMERAAALVSGEIVDAPDLAFLEAEDAKRSVADFDLTLLAGELSPAVEALERTMIRQALAACAGNRAEAARRLGIHRQLLYKKIEVYGLA